MIQVSKKLQLQKYYSSKLNQKNIIIIIQVKLTKFFSTHQTYLVENKTKLRKTQKKIQFL